MRPAANSAKTCGCTLRQADQQAAAPARPGTKPRGVRHHGYLAAKERAAADLEWQQAQGRRGADPALAVAPHCAVTADAAPSAAPRSATQRSVPGNEHTAYGSPGAHGSWDAAWAWWAPPPPPPPPPPLPAWLFGDQGQVWHQLAAAPQPAAPGGAHTAAGTGSRSGDHGMPASVVAGDGSAVLAAAQAQAAKLGDEALAELLTAWFRAGYLSGEHAARAAALTPAPC